MLESFLNKVAGPYDCCETYLLHALLRYYFFGKTLQSYVHRSIFRTESNIYDGAFFTSVKPYILKMYFIRSNFPSKFQIMHTMASSQKMNKKGFLNNNLKKTLRTACVCIVFFFHYFKYMYIL